MMLSGAQRLATMQGLSGKALVSVCGGRPFRHFNYCRWLSQSVTHDIVISGGGMVGTAMACALACEPRLKGKSILLLESSPQTSASTTASPSTASKSYSNRVSALSPATKTLLSRIGAWDKMAAVRIWPVRRMQVWEACSDAVITFDKHDAGTDLAYITENDVTLSALSTCLGELKGRVETRYGVMCEGYQAGDTASDQPFVNISLKGGETLTTRLLVGADGYKSLVRRDCAMPEVGWDYQQSGVVATLTLSSDDSQEVSNCVAWQRFLPLGPIALLPLSPTQSSLVWTTSRAEAARLLALAPESFVDSINAAMWDDSQKDSLSERAGRVMGEFLAPLMSSSKSSAGWQLPPTVLMVDDGSRASFPLGLMHATNYVKPRIALIGDAAHRIHPLAGQGVNLGFGDVACLVDTIGQAASIGADIGSILHLQRYESQRQRHVLPTLAAIDGLNRLYASTLMPVVLARTLGLMFTNSLAPLKAYMASHASS